MSALMRTVIAPDPSPTTDRAPESGRLSSLIGTSPAIVEALSRIERFSRCAAPVLVIGETGTEKKDVAKAIHVASARAGRPFVVSEVGRIAVSNHERELFGQRRGTFTITEGAWTKAEGGSLFLDEVGELDESAQAHVLLAVERRRDAGGALEALSGDVRLIAGTNRDLDVAVRQGRFRADLRDRLFELVVELPPLRERRDDIPSIARRIVHDLAEEDGRASPEITEEAMEFLHRQEWRGNVGELENVLRGAMALAPDATVLDASALKHRPPPKRSGFMTVNDRWKTLKEAKDELLEELESEYLREVLDRSGGNMTLAARYAGVARGHFYRLLKKRGLAR